MKEIANPATRDEAQKKMRAATAPMQSPKFAQTTIEKLQQCFKYLQKQKEVNGNIAVMGFCFGGTYSFALAVNESELKAAVVFYGHAPEPIEKLKTITCPMLAFYGEKDTALVSQLPQLKEAMKQYNKKFEAIIYPNCGHAFFNTTNPVTYNEEAATDAWKKTLAFLSKHLVYISV